MREMSREQFPGVFHSECARDVKSALALAERLAYNGSTEEIQAVGQVLLWLVESLDEGKLVDNSWM